MNDFLQQQSELVRRIASAKRFAPNAQFLETQIDNENWALNREIANARTQAIDTNATPEQRATMVRDIQARIEAYSNQEPIIPMSNGLSIPFNDLGEIVGFWIYQNTTFRVDLTILSDGRTILSFIEKGSGQIRLEFKGIPSLSLSGEEQTLTIRNLTMPVVRYNEAPMELLLRLPAELNLPVENPILFIINPHPLQRLS